MELQLSERTLKNPPATHDTFADTLWNPAKSLCIELIPAADLEQV
jgi:hypothetical protein